MSNYALIRYLPQGTLTYPVRYMQGKDGVTTLDEGDVLTAKYKPEDQKSNIPNPPPMPAVTSKWFGAHTLFSGLVYSGQKPVDPILAAPSINSLNASMPTPIVMGIANWLNLGRKVHAFDRLIVGPRHASNPEWRTRKSQTQVTLYSASPLLWRTTVVDLQHIAARPALRALFEAEIRNTCPWTRLPILALRAIAGEPLLNDRDGDLCFNTDTGDPAFVQCLAEEYDELKGKDAGYILDLYWRMCRLVDFKALTDSAPGTFCKCLVRQ